MAVVTYPKTMLYCPKCRAAYEEGTQRFCTNDGSRLFPLASQGKSGAPAKGVFANILSKTLSQEKIKIGAPARFVKNEEKQPEPILQIPVESKILPITLIQPEEKVKPPAETKKTDPQAKPLPRLIRPNEIAASQAKLGDRSVNPTGRLALSWENTDSLIGKTIKGRYQIVEQLSEDELSVAYLAEDKIVADRKAVIRVLMVEKDAADYLSKIFAEERVSLSHINHPNVAHLFDSGMLPEGNILIVTEYIEGVSLKEKLLHSGAFSPRQTARIIRQVANALSEVHENGILHRNLKPQNVILGISETGLKSVKVTDFAVYDGFEEQTQENIKYLSPEQLEGKMPTYASDVYSLAVIAYQMLTGRLPFNYSSERELLKAQREGLTLRPTNLRLDLAPPVDDVLEKALAYKPSDRYPKARDFGDAFYNSLNVAAPWEKEEVENIPKEELFPIVSLADSKQEEEKSEPKAEPSIEIEEILAAPVPQEEVFEIAAFETQEEDQKKENITVKAFEAPALATPAPEQQQPVFSRRIVALTLGLILLGIGTWAVWNYFANRQNSQVNVSQNNTDAIKANNPEQNQKSVALGTEDVKPGQTESAAEIESPPMPRQITPPRNYEFFQNSRENLTGDLKENFRAFSFYYPNDWVKGSSDTNFVDVARVGATGTPIEQILISYYESKGTLAADREKFSQLVQQSNQYFAQQFPNYRLVSEGETKINGEWKAYEMKFRGEGITVNGDRVTIWGRRLWMPAARPGIKPGFILTLLATSLSPEVKSVSDVGVKGELATVLETFEPAALDSSE